MAKLIWSGNRWRRVIALALAVVTVGIVATSILIGSQVRAAMASAQKTQPGNGVAALVAVASSDEAPVAERNRAIWALGQLGAHSALPMLKSLASGGTECDHVAAVCQREVRKAMALCEGRFNVGALVWRHGRLAAESKTSGRA
jgi:hypothetical protein